MSIPESAYKEYAYPSESRVDFKERGNIPIGLTKREYFAAAALQGILSDISVRDMSIAAKNAVYAADQLISELMQKR